MGRRCITASILCVCLVIASTVVGQEKDDSQEPQRFRDLFKVKQLVLWKTPTDTTRYTIQLLKTEQTKQIEEQYAKQIETEQRLSNLEQLLEEEQTLERLAALLKEKQELESRRVRSAYTRQAFGTPYVVTHVGEDYVTLMHGELERFVPFQSIRYLYQTEELATASRIEMVRRRSLFSRNSDSAQRVEIQLQHAKATDVAKIIEKLYPDIGLNINIDADGNVLRLESQKAGLGPIQQLIESLEAQVEARARAEGGRGS
jgi:hypothetical protein